MNKKRITLSLLFFSISTGLVGCSMYSSKPGKKSEIVGTYQLDKIEKKDESGDNYDYKSQINANAAFTIDENGYGYYAYSDKDTKVNVSQIFFEYVPDTEEENMYKAVKMINGFEKVYDWDKKVGCLDEPTMGFNVKKGTLSYTIPKHKASSHEVEYLYVSYKRVSKATDISAINSIFNTNYEFEKPFELKRLTGFYVGTYQLGEGAVNENYGKYEYVILDMESYRNNSLKVYYSLTAEPGKKEAIATVEFVNGNLMFKDVKVTVLGVQFSLNSYYQTLGTVLFYEESNEGVTTFSNFFEKTYSTATTVDELIAELLA